MDFKFFKNKLLVSFEDDSVGFLSLHFNCISYGFHFYVSFLKYACSVSFYWSEKEEY